MALRSLLSGTRIVSLSSSSKRSLAYLLSRTRERSSLTASPLSRLGSSRQQPMAQLSSSADGQSASPPKKKAKTVKITFVDRDGDEMTVDAKIGDSLLEVAKQFDVEVEGACEGTLSCSTCHMIVDKDWYDKIPDFLTEEEQDMLDLAYGLTDTSRLGCQIIVSEAINGIRLTIPSETRDIRNT